MLRFFQMMLRDRRRRVLVTSTVTLYLSLVSMHLLAGKSGWTSVYEALRVFTFDVGYLPEGTGLLDTAQWIGRLAAPFITLGIAAEVVDHLGLLHLPMLFFQLRGRNHVVVVGAGRLGRHVCERLHAAGVRVIAIEKDAENDHVADLRRRGIPVLIGDGASRQTLRVARVELARTVICAAGRDLVNLEVALTAREVGPKDLEVFAHVVDDTVRDRLRLREPVHVFSSFEWAAAHLVRRSVVADGPPALYVIAGYGRLGRAVLRHLRKATTGPFLVLDPVLKEGEIRDPDVDWRALDMLAPPVFELLRARPDHQVRFLVCTDRDEDNLRFALEVSDRLPGRNLKIYLRMFRAGHLAKALPEQLEIAEMAGVIDTRTDRGDLLGLLRQTAHCCHAPHAPAPVARPAGA